MHAAEAVRLAEVLRAEPTVHGLRLAEGLDRAVAQARALRRHRVRMEPVRRWLDPDN
jgi:hypothetical protein